MIQVNTKDAIKEIRRSFKELSDKQLNTGVYRAINHTLAKSRTQSNRQIRSIYNIALRDINERMRVDKAFLNKLYGRLNAFGGPLPLYLFKPKQTKAGVSVAIKKGQRQIIRKSFLAQMKSGHNGVFARGRYSKGEFQFRKERIRKAGGYKIVNGRYQPVNNDLEITELNTISVPKAFIMPAVINPVVRDMGDTVQQRMIHELTRIRGKA